MLERTQRSLFLSVRTGLYAVLTACCMTANAAAQMAAGQMDHDDHGAKAHAIGDGENRIYMYQGPAEPGGDYDRTSADYTVPAVTLQNRRGEPVRLDRLLGADRPVALQFIFTSCATICPVLSAGMAGAKPEIMSRAPDTRLISISIDPSHDTPENLAAYAERFDAGAEWTFLTGTAEDVRKVLIAFDALYKAGNKMYHRPYTYLRAAPGAPWLRLNGLLGAQDLAREHATLLAPRPGGSAGGR